MNSRDNSKTSPKDRNPTNQTNQPTKTYTRRSYIQSSIHTALVRSQPPDQTRWPPRTQRVWRNSPSSLQTSTSPLRTTSTMPSTVLNLSPMRVLNGYKECSGDRKKTRDMGRPACQGHVPVARDVLATHAPYQWPWSRTSRARPQACRHVLEATINTRSLHATFIHSFIHFNPSQNCVCRSEIRNIVLTPHIHTNHLPRSLLPIQEDRHVTCGPPFTVLQAPRRPHIDVNVPPTPRLVRQSNVQRIGTTPATMLILAHTHYGPMFVPSLRLRTRPLMVQKSLH